MSFPLLKSLILLISPVFLGRRAAENINPSNRDSSKRVQKGKKRLSEKKGDQSLRRNSGREGSASEKRPSEMRRNSVGEGSASEKRPSEMRRNSVGEGSASEKRPSENRPLKKRPLEKGGDRSLRRNSVGEGSASEKGPSENRPLKKKPSEEGGDRSLRRNSVGEASASEKRQSEMQRNSVGEASASTHLKVKEEESKIEISVGQPLIISYQTKSDDQKDWPELNLSREPQRPVISHLMHQVYIPDALILESNRRAGGFLPSSWVSKSDHFLHTASPCRCIY
jgi:hypothetical protein